MKRLPEDRHCVIPLHLLITLILSLPLRLSAQTAPADKLSTNAVSTNKVTVPGTNSEERGSSDSSKDAIARIRDEGMNHSEVMKTLSYLTEAIGPRLTGSPHMKRANEWTRDKLTSWGLTNSHLEAWGPFGRGWSLKRFSAEVIEPQGFPLIGCPNAWSPGLAQPLVAEVIYFDAKSNSDLEKFKGKLRGAIVLSGTPRELKPAYEAMAVRLAETNLLQLANAGERTGSRSGFNARERPSGEMPRGRTAGFTGSEEPGPANSLTNSNPATQGRGGPRGRFRGQARFLSFLEKEGAALIVSSSSMGDGGTFYVSAASVPSSDTNASGSFSNAPRAWSTNAPSIPPQITIAAEDYNRLVRMIQQGEKPRMAVDLQVAFQDEDPMAYNTVAEIPGTDLKKEIVMLGAHMDSWHAGTGATDNGAGVAATMEAVRILTALQLRPRRTVRIGLWSGEEEGLLGSKAYVSKHFGYYTNEAAVERGRARAPKDTPEEKAAGFTNANAPNRKLVRRQDYEKLSVYFNLDNGAGRIRGVYLQNNEAVRPLFRRWLAPFADLGAETISFSNTGGTDHVSFDTIGLPGFQFIQDPIEYNTRTHHSNEDVFDRVPPDDLKQAATIIAAFVYEAATMDGKLPRKPLSN